MHLLAFLRRAAFAATALLVVPALLAAQEAKSLSPPAGPAPGGGIHPAATGGPDGFGYTFADSTEANCSVGFVDISSTGTSVVTGDDVGSLGVTLGAPFSFYGSSFTQLDMTSNGYITTDVTDNGPDLSNDCPIPATPSTPGGTTGARIYPLHDDLVLDGGASAGFYQYFAVCPRQSDRCAANEDCSIFQWNDARTFSAGVGGPTFTFEAILYHQTNDLVFVYGTGHTAVNTGSSSTEGIQTFAPNPSTALQYACNTGGSISDNSAVCIFNPNAVPGSCAPASADLSLAKTASSGTVPPGGNLTYTLTVSNGGPDDATNVVVVDTLPAGVSYVSDTCGGVFAPGPPATVTWNAGTVANGAQAVCAITVTVTVGAGQLDNTATATSDTADPVAANNDAAASVVVQQSVIEVPTLGKVGLALLMLALLGAGLLFVRRH